MEEIKMNGLTITEKERQKTTIINNEKFTMQIPLPYDKIRISTQIAKVAGSQDIKSFPEEDYGFIRMVVTLNNVVIDHPKWWEGADQCMDSDLLNQLWQFYLNFETDFQSWLKKNTTKGKLDKLENSN